LTSIVAAIVVVGQLVVVALECFSHPWEFYAQALLALATNHV
jgi:hypothetical protein